MAYAALVSLIQSLEQILHPDLAYEKQITRIHEQARSFLALLEDSLWKFDVNLEVRIRDAAYQAEDMIESNSLNLIIPTSSRSERRIEHMHHESKLQHGVLQILIGQFDSILVQVSMIKEDENVVDLRQKKIGSAYETSNKITTLVEIEEDLLHVKERLTQSPSKLIIVSIVGAGGIGKTTLAKNIYNDPLIVENFDFLAWVTVSQKYKVEEKLISLLGSIGNGSFGLRGESINELQLKLFQILKGRKYLVVMDDIWDTESWDDFKRFFPDDNIGSRIILTTRLLGVATYADSGYIHPMKYLSLDGSWNLLLDKVFGRKHCPPELEEFGKKIVKKCRGLPLAIMLIGGLLSNVDKSPEIWRYVAKNISSAITGTDYNFETILSLSYYNLPQHLKACFFYMGVFPGDQEIHVSHLIKLWVAEGFIKPNGDKSLEEVAKENLKDLIDRSLVLVERLSSDGEIKTCSIHDLLRDLCIRKAREENFLAVIRNKHLLNQNTIKNKRRISIRCPYSP